MVRLRKATPDDIPFMMATERLPGYEWFVGQWDAARHLEVVNNSASAVLVGLDDAGVAQGFAILRELDEPSNNVYLQRIAITRPGSGFGRALLHAVTDFVFTELPTHRMWLLVKVHNAHARYIYEATGFSQEGRLRQAHIEPDGSRADSLMFSKLRSEWQPGRASATT